jgi:hypothetical protein
MNLEVVLSREFPEKEYKVCLYEYCNRYKSGIAFLDISRAWVFVDRAVMWANIFGWIRVVRKVEKRRNLGSNQWRRG